MFQPTKEAHKQNEENKEMHEQIVSKVVIVQIKSQLGTRTRVAEL